MAGIRQAVLQLKLMDGVSEPARAIQAVLGKLNGVVDGFNRQRAAANAAFRDAGMQAAALAASMAVPIRQAMQFEDALADFNKLANLTGPALKTMGGDFVQLSKEIPLTAEELLAIGSAVASTGAPIDQVIDRVRMIAKAAVAWGMSTDQAGDALSKIQAGLGLTTAETENLANAINLLGNSTAAEAPAIVDFQKRIGAMGKMAGLTAEQTAALGASIISMGVESEVGATGLQAMLRALTRGEAATAGQERAFARLGLSAAKTAKAMQADADGTILDVLERLRALPAEERLSVANQLFGDEGRPILALIDQLDVLKKNLADATDAAKTAGSVHDEYNGAINTTSQRLKILRNRVTAASRAFGEVLLPSVDLSAGSLGGFADTAEAFIKANPEMVRRIALTTAGMVGMRLAATGARAALYGILRPTNLLVAGLGYLAYQNFDQVAASLNELKLLAADLASTKFVKEFLSGAGESLKAMGDGAQRLIGALRELAGEGTALRAWLDSVDGAGWGKALGSAAVGLAAIGATAGALAAVAGPVRAIAGAALWLSGIRPAWALLRFLRSLGRSSEAIQGTTRALQGLGNEAAQAGQNAGNRFGTSLASAARGVIARAGLGAFLAAEIVGSLPDTKEGIEAFFQKSRERSKGWNDWLEENVGTPRRWLGLDRPDEAQQPVAGVDQQQNLRDELAATTKDWPTAARRAIVAYGNALAAGGDTAEQEAAAIGQRIEDALSVDGRPYVDTAELERAMGIARELAAAVRGVGSGAQKDALQAQLDAVTAEWPTAAQRAIKSYGNALAQGGAEAEAEADRIGQNIERALSVTGHPAIETGQLERALGLARQLAATLRGGASAPASSGGTPRFGGPRAKGGPVTGGRPYLVGERGPEVVVPGRSGTVVPNHALGGGGIVLTINQTLQVSGHGAADLQKLAEDAARRVSTAVTNALDRKLNRSAQVAFGNLKYGDA
ncbi:phage tail tape measure protein [Shinella pollutisoli]|uniref:Phage tail tape measure protein n=1 Tax=Shinella pollutisoli TaxID=2250594 RepID=A0ABV7DNH6_9HYPH|nr:phage tail tape measure protein [Shinella pollutisoli]